jgi:hypothetical protein
LENRKWQKKYKAQGFYIENKFEYLCVVTLGDGGISSSFLVVRRRGRISYSSYGIRTTPPKKQNKTKQRRKGKYICFFFLQW